MRARDINNNLRGFMWSFCACMISALNDLLTKISGVTLDTEVIIFFRFFLGTIFLLPFIKISTLFGGSINFDEWRWNNIQITSHKFFNLLRLCFHLMRSLLWVIGILLWTHGAINIPLHMVTTMSFLIPIFNIILGMIFLKESFNMTRFFLVVMAFCGVLIAVTFTPIANNYLWFLLLADIIFSFLDLINKSMISKAESTTNMLFFSNFFSSILIYPFVHNWVTGNIFGLTYGAIQSLIVSKSLFLLILLGIGSNLILFCILRSFSLSTLSSIQYVRYLELPISCVLGAIFCHDIPCMHEILGYSIIILSSILYYRHINNKRDDKIIK